MPSPHPRIERVGLQDQVYHVLKERVLDRTYPPGARLNVDALARELSVSSTPIREALGRLVAEGLAVAEPFVGFHVAPLPGVDYYGELFDFRLVLETWAAGETARLRPPAVLATLEEAVEAMRAGTLSKRYARYRDFVAADAAFHAAVVAGTGNRPAIKAYDDLRVHHHLARLYIERDQDSALTHAQHAAIYEAIRAGRVREAGARMREHIAASKASLLGSATVPGPVSP